METEHFKLITVHGKLRDNFFIQALFHMLISARHDGMGAHDAFCIAVACRFYLDPEREIDKCAVQVLKGPKAGWGSADRAHQPVEAGFQKAIFKIKIAECFICFV
jgi:hypothetical protein